MRDQSPDQIAAWLRGRPSLHELREAFPDEWIEVERGLAEAGRTGNVEHLRAPVVLSRRDHVRPVTTDLVAAGLTAAVSDAASRRQGNLLLLLMAIRP